MSAPHKLDARGVAIEDSDGNPVPYKAVESIVEIVLDGGNRYAVQTLYGWLGYAIPEQSPEIQAEVRRTRLLAERRRKEREKKRKQRAAKKRKR